MPPFPDTNVTEALLEHAGWMRKLALELVGDGPRADDLAQDTWVRALEQPPRTDLPLRGWLATVMRNILRQDRRGDARRSIREARTARGERDSREEEGLEVLARMSMQRELVEAVLALDEPYRTTLGLRYFEELSPKAVAERQGVPISTVKTRLARGLDQLRGQLDSKYGGDGKAWAVALIPVMAPPGNSLGALVSSTETTLGALIVNTKILLAALILTAIGTGVVLNMGEAAPEEATSDVLHARAPEPETAAPSSVSSTKVQPSGLSAVTERTAIASPSESTLGTEEEARPAVMVKGRVVDMQGRPVGGISIEPLGESEESEEEDGQAAATLGSAPLARSLQDGSFRFPLTEDRPVSAFGVSDPRYMTVMTSSRAGLRSGKEIILVVAQRGSIAGKVVDEFGSPVAGAELELSPAETFRGDLGLVLDYSREVHFRTRSDEAGAFAFDEAPLFPGGFLEASASSFADTRISSPPRSNLDVVLVMAQPAVAGERLNGVVVDPSGLPVEGATVSMGIDTEVSDSNGEFTFHLSNPDSFNARMSVWMELSIDSLLALKEGYLPGVFEAPDRDANGEVLWPDQVVLRLGEQPLSIEGRVVDEEGNPLGGQRVWINDPTFFGGRRTEGRDFPSLTHVETELGGLDPSWPFVETDPDGSFSIDGLLDREYELVVMDPATLMRSVANDVRGGDQGLELVLSTAESFPVIRGRVVDGRGEPVEGVSIRAFADAFQTLVQGQVASTRHASGSTTTTDENGLFEIHDIPKERVYFRLDHPDTIPKELGRSEQALRQIVGESHDDFVIVVPRRCHFQIELASPDDADEFEVRDAEDNALPLSEFNGSGRRDGYRFPIAGGRTNLLAVGDEAATLVLFKEGTEVKRTVVSLAPGEQPTLRP